MHRPPTKRPLTHPGEMLASEFLEPLGMTQIELAHRINVPFSAHQPDSPAKAGRDSRYSVTVGTAPRNDGRVLAESSVDTQIRPVVDTKNPASPGLPTLAENPVLAVCRMLMSDFYWPDRGCRSLAGSGVYTEGLNLPQAWDLYDAMSSPEARGIARIKPLKRAG
jgi:hypothetical protein